MSDNVRALSGCKGASCLHRGSGEEISTEVLVEQRYDEQNKAPLRFINSAAHALLLIDSHRH